MIPLSIARLYGAYQVGGSDAGQRITLFYPTSRSVFPILPDAEEIEPDSQAGTFGLAWYHGLNQLGQPKFQVRDDVVLNSKIAWHEAGHALEDIICLRTVQQNPEYSLEEAIDEVRTRYWTFRNFPGTWQGALAYANRQTGQGAAWAWLPGESIAESISAATGGYVESEWTATYGKDLALRWWEPPGNTYDPSGGGMRAREFWTTLMNEVDMDEATVRQIAQAAANEAVARAGLDPNTFEFVKQRLAKDAHHRHAMDGTITTEPVEQ